MCHLCRHPNRPATEIVKCKLHASCDGDHVDLCVECAQVYDSWKASFSAIKGGDDAKFAMLQARVPRRDK